MDDPTLSVDEIVRMAHAMMRGEGAAVTRNEEDASRGFDAELRSRTTFDRGPCEECGLDKSNFELTEGFMVCRGCGTTQGTDISMEAEWNNYKGADGGDEPDKARAYCAKDEMNPFSQETATRMAKGLRVNYTGKDGKKKSFDISKLLDQMNYSHKQKSFDMVKGFLENSLTNKFHVTIVKTSQILWGEIMKSGKITRAGVRKGLIACCVYYSCLHHNNTSSPLDICQSLGMEDTKEFVKGDKEFKEILENHPIWGDLIRKTSNSDSFFSQFCTKLSLDFHVLRMSSITFNFHRKTLAQVIPKSAAAGCILFVCMREGIAMTKTQISKELGVCIPTIVKVLGIIEKSEEKRIKNGVDMPVHKKVVTTMSKYNYDGKEMVALGATKGRAGSSKA